MVRKSATSRAAPRLEQSNSSLKAIEKGGDDASLVLSQQQLLLDVFKRSFEDSLISDTLNTNLQEVKQALYSRDFAKAFGSDESLEVYAARWSPTRALCYTSILDGIKHALKDIYQTSSAQDRTDDDQPQITASTLRLLAIGGGAAEIVAFGAFLGQSGDLRGEITLVDLAPWQTAVQRLHHDLTTTPPLSKYASEAARAKNSALVDPSRLTATTVQHDVLTLEREELCAIVGRTPLLVTALFTLNELFTASGMAKTATFLLSLGDVLPRGSLLLVVDSPGSYSETVVGSQSKKYPMQWLLDKILLKTEDGKWEKLDSYDSVWFRLSESLDYPIPLEDMRYQMHFYRVA